jgi:hypothetical protein
MKKDNKVEFRKLRADEIQARISTVNGYGCGILLYKDARVDQTLLDETFGIYGWQRTHQMIGENLYCTISVWDAEKEQWISKQDVGTESYTEKQKGQASDSFKRACFNLGIGRELYTAPDIFIFKDDLAGFSEKDGKYTCRDKFSVANIVYDGDNIASVTLNITFKGKTIQKTFGTSAPAKIEEAKEESKANIVPVKKTTSVKKTSAKAETKVETPKSETASPDKEQKYTLTNNTKILIGNCLGKTYKEVVGTKEYESFLKWTLTTSGAAYEDPEKKFQFRAFKSIARKMFKEAV